jgi:TP901 family phage tail tape measure protein
MADFESNISIGIDTSQALAAIKNLQRQISEFQTSMARGSAAQAAEASKLQQELVSSINSTGKFSASIRNIQTTTESFTSALEKNKLSFGQYFKYAAASTKTFGNSFQNEMSVIEKTARERVKDLQTQYVKLGRDASGAMKAIAVRPLTLDLEDLGTKTAIAAQKQQILNQLLKQGSTNLLNFGKNTQWAGRQLMVGFTIPLTIFGTTAAKTFMELEEQVIKFKKVYGDLFTTGAERDKALQDIKELANEFTKYGVAVSETVGIAADAAAAGFGGADLQRQTEQAIRLSILGQLDYQKALDTTISLQNAFQTSSEELAEAIDFLNAVENQTVVALDDITTAIPKVAPVIKALGGDVKDLAFFLAAMKEGGVNASEGANALKSGLASLVNPTDKASRMLEDLGINIRGIVERNVGDLKGTVVEFAQALDALDPLNRARAIEQLFGKFQFARISTLFDNVIRDGTQASRVLDLAGESAAGLASMAESELGMSAASSMNKFRKSIEGLQAALAPIGELFLKIVTPIIDFATDVLKNFNKLDDGVKSFVAGLLGVLGVIGPVALMTFGLLANGVANIIKGFLAVRNAFLNVGKQSQILGEQTDYMTQKQLQELAVAASLEQAHMNLAQAFTSEKNAIEALVKAYDKAIQRQAQYRGVGIATNIGQNPVKMQKGGVVTVPGSGKGDKVPAMLEPGEAVIPSAMAQKYSGFIQGMISGSIPGFQKGVFLGMPRSGKSTGKNRDAAEQIYQMFLQSSYKNVPPTQYGHQIAPTSGHSFPIFGLGGVYMSPAGKKVFVKPVMDEKAAMAEMRGTQISRQVHGLEAPEQRIVVMRDPQDVSGKRRFLALESDLDAKFVNNEPKAVFNEEQYFRQLVASLVRVDKDLSAGNVFGNVVADVGPAGVFSRASGVRDYTTDLPSMEDQAMVNLLGIKGGAKRAFAESTVQLMARMTADQYHQYMIAEIQRTIPLLRQTVASFGLTNPTEADAYAAMIKRLEQGLGVNWRKFHEIHSAVKVSAPRQAANPKRVPGYADGIVSVPGPKGAGDVMPAMLSPGEAVIPAKQASKYAPLIQGMIAGKIPGFKRGFFSQSKQFGQSGEYSAQASHYDIFAPSEMASTLKELREELQDFTVDVFMIGDKLEDGTYEVSKITDNLASIADESRDIVSGGKTYAGTTTIESKERNQSYNAAGIAGAPFTLEGVVAAGEKAEQALLSGSNESIKYASQLRELVEEGRIAREKLRSSNSVQERLTFIQENVRKSLEESYRANTKNADVTQAAAYAEQRLADVQDYVAKLLQDGVDEEAALQEAKKKYAALLLKSGTGEFVSGPSGTGGNVVRDVATGRGRGNLRRVGQQPGERTFAQSGRSTAAVASALYSELRATGENAVSAALKAIAAGARTALKIASPSVEMHEIGDDAGKGIVNGAKQNIDDAQQAGTQIGQKIVVAAAQSGTTQSGIFRIGGPNSRRVTTDPAAYAADAGPRLFGSSNNAVDLLADKLTPAMEDLSDSTTKARSGFETMNSKLMNVSFAFSSIAALTSMFGGELSGINEALFNLSNIIFALSGVMALVNMLEGVRASILAKANAKSFGELFSNLPVLFGKLKGGIVSLIPKILQFARFLGPIAAAFGAFQLMGELQKQQQQKIEGLGNAAFAAGKKLETIGEILNIQFRNIDRSVQFETAGGLAPGGGERAAAARESEGFKTAIETSAEDGGFKEDLETIKNATLAEAQFALNNLALELIAAAPEGTDPEAIREFVAALAAEAGKTEIDLIVNLDLADKSTFDQIEKEAVQSAETIRIAYEGMLKKIEETPVTPMKALVSQLFGPDIFRENSDELAAGLNDLAAQYSAFFLATEAGFLNGTLSAEEYRAKISSITSAIASLGSEGTIVIEKIFADFGVEEELRGIEDVNSQLILLEALAAGVDFTEAGIDIKAIDKMDDYLASTEDVEKGTKELEKAQNAVGKAVAKTAEQLKKADYDERADQILIGTDALDEQLRANEDIVRLYPELVEQLGSEESALNAVNDERIRSLILQAEEQDLIDGGTANRDKVIASLNALASSEELVNDIRGAADMTTYLNNLKEQNAVLGWLTQNGMTTAQALQVIGNSTLYAGAAAAKSSGDYDGFVEEMKEILSLQATLSGGGGGGGQKSPFQQAVENLKEQRYAAGDVISAYNKLRDAGLSVSAAFDAAQDPVIATAVASTKVGTDKWRQLVNLVKQAALALRQSRLLEVFAEQEASNALLEAFSKIAPMLSRMGLSLDDINAILGDPTLAQAFVDDLKDGVINSQRVLDVINQIPESKRIQILFDMSTPEGMMSQFDEAFSRQMEYLDLQQRAIERQYDSQEDAARSAVESAQDTLDAVQGRIDSIQSNIDDKQRDIELTITRPIEELNESIQNIEREIEMSYERPIADMQEEASDLSRELELMDRQAEKINEEFDAQEEALARVNELNADVVEKDKERLSVAEALATGSVAEAARAMRQARTQEQQRARERAAKALEEARERQLANIRSSSGQTREQIEERLLQINDAIYELEEKREIKQKEIQDIQDKIYQIELKRRPLLDDIRDLEDQIYEITENELKVAEQAVKTAQDNADALEDQRNAALAGIDAQRLEWELLKDEALKAMLESDGYLTSLEDARDMVNKIAEAWRNVGTESANANSNITTTPTIPTTPPNNPGNGGGDPVVEDKYPPVGRKGSREDESVIIGKDKYTWNSQKKAWVRTHTGGTKGNWLRVAPKPTGAGNYPGDYVDGWTWDYAKGWYSQGGFVSGPGTSTSDSIPARLSDGEFVIRAAIVRKLGTKFLEDLNNDGKISGYKFGGLVIPDKPSKLATKKPAAKKPAAKPKINIQSAMAADKKANSSIISNKAKTSTTNNSFDWGKSYMNSITKTNAQGVPLIMAGTEGGAIASDLIQSFTNIGSGQGTVWDGVNLALAPLAFTGIGSGVSKAGKVSQLVSKATAPIKNKVSAISKKTANALDERLAAKVIEAAIARPGFSVTMPSNAAKDILRGGTLKNQFEIGSAKIDPNYIRVAQENKVLGIPLDAPSSARPTYGALTNRLPIPQSIVRRVPGMTGEALRLTDKYNPNTLMYGGGNPVVASGNISNKLRASLTVGDSFDSTAKAYNMFDRSSRKLVANDVLSVLKRGYRPSYIETQFYDNPTSFIKKFTPVKNPYSAEVNNSMTGVLQSLRMAQQSRLNNPLRIGKVAESSTRQYFKRRKGYSLDNDPFAAGYDPLKDPFYDPDAKLAMGGLVSAKYFNSGGLARGSDIVPSMLTPGEFVMSKYAVQNYGVDKMKAMNSGTYNGDSVYNYEVNVNVKSDANPDQIAKAVMTQIKQIDSQRIRSNRF